MLRDYFDEFQFEAERGGDGLQVGKPDVFALLDVADGGLIGNASPFGQRVPSQPMRFARGYQAETVCGPRPV